MTELKFSPPTKDAPGYLRRQRRILEIQQQAKTPTPEVIDKMVDLILPFITEPADRDMAREALLDASETQWDELLAAAAGRGSPLASES